MRAYRGVWWVLGFRRPTEQGLVGAKVPSPARHSLAGRKRLRRVTRLLLSILPRWVQGALGYPVSSSIGRSLSPGTVASMLWGFLIWSFYATSSVRPWREVMLATSVVSSHGVRRVTSQCLQNIKLINNQPSSVESHPPEFNKTLQGEAGQSSIYSGVENVQDYSFALAKCIRKQDLNL